MRVGDLHQMKVTTLAGYPQGIFFARKKFFLEKSLKVSLSAAKIMLYS